jgi:simple sugar transport system permease protein
LGLEAVFTADALVAVFAITLRIAPTVLYASLGEVITERSGVVNLGLEGIMLLSAFTAFYFSYVTGDPITGLGVALLVGLAMGLLHAMLTVLLSLNQVVVGLSIWIFGFGFSDVLYRMLFRGVQSPTVKTLTELQVPVLSDIPVIGQILFKHNALVYAAFLLIPVVWFFLYRTRLGLLIRAAGENPKVVKAAGHSVLLIRTVAVVIGAVLASVSGAYFTTAFLRSYITNITFGRGFIALAMVYFGNWSPVRLLVPLLIFNYVDSLQLMMQAADVGIRYYFLNMLPFVMLIAMMPVFGRNVKPPSALMKPFR